MTKSIPLPACSYSHGHAHVHVFRKPAAADKLLIEQHDMIGHIISELIVDVGEGGESPSFFLLYQDERD